MINGKLRTKQKFSLNLKKQEIEKLVMKNETVSKWVKESKIKKVIIIPNKIISLVC